MKKTWCLSQLFRVHGVTLRKHTGEYPAWTARTPVVVDLTRRERAILRRDGDAALDAFLRAHGQYPFPCLSLTRLAAPGRDMVLASAALPATIVVPALAHYRKLAANMAQWMRVRGVAAPCIKSDVEADIGAAPAGAGVVVLGGAHENRMAAALADACRYDADADMPGANGLSLRTLRNPGNAGHDILAIACGAARCGEVLRILEKLGAQTGRAESGGLVLPPTWIVKLDRQACPALRDKAAVMGKLEKMWPYRNLRARPARTARQLVARAAAGFDGGGTARDRYNVYPLILANTAADIFSCTGDRDYLQIYLGMLRALLNYFTATPNGASIPSDIDFYAGRFIANWELLEAHLPVTDAERLIYVNLLLATAEMCAGYKAARWPTRPDVPRHNHETFGALTAFFAGRYFYEHYRVPAARGWLRVARDCFTGPLVERRFKYRENANQYQWLAPAHKLIYDRATGRNIFTRNGCLRKVAENIIITTDNFGYPCDFGDAGAPISGGALGAAFLDAAALRCQAPACGRVAAHIRAALPDSFGCDIPPSTAWLPGCRRQRDAHALPGDQVSIMPLDDHIRRQYAPDIPRRRAFDKLALREGWGRDAQYLLLEGYSYPAGGHAHRDQNSIIRLNHLGRVWLVDNSYGKSEKKQGVAAAFKTRQTGPEDHNTVQFIKPDGSFAAYPNLCSLNTCRDYGAFVIVQSALPGMAGGDWQRSVLWCKGLFFLIVDRIRMGAEKIEAVRCQWNMLGRLELAGRGLGVCAQTARRLYIHFDRAIPTRLASYSNLNWRDQLKPDIYPYAEPPIQKMNQTYDLPRPGDQLVFANMFYAVRGGGPRFGMERTGPAAWALTGRNLNGLRLTPNPFLRHDKGAWFFACN